MIPRFPQTLAELAMKIAVGFAADAASNYTAANLAMTGVLLQAASQEAERHIDTLMTDITDLKILFAGLSPLPIKELATFVESEPESLKSSDVTKLHAQALRLLIELHEWSESHDPQLEATIWCFLENHVERHHFDLML